VTSRRIVSSLRSRYGSRGFHDRHVSHQHRQIHTQRAITVVGLLCLGQHQSQRSVRACV
jgi:hypothetical protein